MSSLFPPENDQPTHSSESSAQTSSQPLAARMRPRTLDEVVGQKHLLGAGKLLRRAIEADRFSSILLYGPPGVGKTSLAHVIAKTTNSRFESLNGVESNVAEIRKKIEAAEGYQKLRNQTTILFIDEIHRFNKSQQDVLLPHIERGTVRFIGATTENPLFYVNSPLVSRSQIFELEPVPQAELERLIQLTLHDQERGLGKYPIQITDEAISHLAIKADGDARKALTALEIGVLTTPPNSEENIEISLEVAEESIQQKAIVYDRAGDAHYDTISAFIKSIRGSDPDAALYWLAKMLHAGEDPRFIARRLIISASEDIGLADSQGLRVALAAHQAAEIIGMPEARITLAHATVYLATAPKSNRAYLAITEALHDVAQGSTLSVPPHLRTQFRKKIALRSGADEAAQAYLYSHDYEGGFVPQRYLPEGRSYYDPTENGMEKRVKERLDYWQSQLQQEND